MSKRLAIFTDDLGASFIDKHLSGLSPGRTVACGSFPAGDLAKIWPVNCPVLLTDRFDRLLSVRLARRAGMRVDSIKNRKIEKFLKQHRIEVVLGEYLDQFLDVVPILERLGIPYVIQGHGVDVSAALTRPGMAEKYLCYQSAKAILTRSSLHRDRLIALGLPRDKVHVNIGGVEVPDECQVRPVASGRRFLALGRMVGKKGPMYLFESFRRAHEKDADLRLDVIGEGPVLSAVLQYIDIYGLQDSITLHGVVSEEKKIQLMAECGVLVQHSLRDLESGDEEGLPAAIQEAMAAGMAVVSTRHTGIPDAVVEGKTGYLVDERDVAGMAEAMVDVPSKAAEFGHNGYQEARVKHAWACEQQRLRIWLFDDNSPDREN